MPEDTGLTVEKLQPLLPRCFKPCFMPEIEAAYEIILSFLPDAARRQRAESQATQAKDMP